MLEIKAVKDKSSRIFLTVWGLGFAGIGGLFTAILVYSVWLDLRPFFWEIRECRIVSSAIQGPGREREPHVEYEYGYGARILRNDEITTQGFMDRKEFMKTLKPSGKEIAGLEVGRVLPCYVNAGLPEQAVLRRRIPWYGFFLFLPLVFVLLGLGAILAALGFLKIPEGPISSRAGRRNRGGGRPAGGLHSSKKSSPIKLRPRRIRNQRAIAYGIAALVSNGAALGFFLSMRSVFPVAAYALGCVFAIPGILLVFAAVSSAAATTNPPVELDIESPLLLGQRSQIRWRIGGDAGKVTELEISLVGREEVTYRRGTDSHSDSRVFETVQVARLARQDLVKRSGSAWVEIPAITAPSFSAPNNRISWYLRVRGVIPNWADIDDQYLVTVSWGEPR